MKKILSLLFSLVLLGGVTMSPIGNRDFGGSNEEDVSTIDIPSGEIPVRFTEGFGSLYRTGSWLFADDFNSSTLAAWQGTPALDTTAGRAWRGTQSVRLLTSAVLNNSQSMSKFFPLYSTRMGLEILFAPASSPVSYTMDFNMHWKRASDLFPNSLFASVRILVDASQVYSLQLFEDNGGTGAYTTEVTPLNINLAGVERWHTLKFIADFTTGKYDKLWIDNYQYDFSTKPIAKSISIASGSGMYQTIQFLLTTQTAAAKQVNLADFIFTKDEP